MSKSLWTRERNAVLAAYAAAGLTRYQISAIMATSVQSLTVKCNIMGLDVPLGIDPKRPPRPPRPSPDNARWQRYEDITPAEARIIAATAPPCGRFSKPAGDARFSQVGCAAGMCVR